jgi:cytochrome c biogenesis protein CcdA
MFTTTTCIGCVRAEEFINSLDAEYPLDSGGTTRVDKRIINISEQDGAAIAQRFFEEYNVPQSERRTPILFYTGGHYMIGDHVITQNLEMLIRAGALQNFQEIPVAEGDMSLSLPLIFGAGLLGGVNPCSVSMVLMLLSLLSSKRDRIVRAGVSYIASKLITYLFLGLALYRSLQALDSAAFRFAVDAAKWVAVALAAGLCVFNVLDYFNARREKYGRIRVQLPKGLRAFNNELIKKAVNSGARFMIPLIFLLGVVISAGEFLCTGQIYLATILYVMRSGDVSAVPAFLTYVIAMIIPMSVLLIVCARGRRLLEMSEFARKNLPIIKLANAALFLAFAIYMIGAK